MTFIYQNIISYLLGLYDTQIVNPVPADQLDILEDRLETAITASMKLVTQKYPFYFCFQHIKFEDQSDYDV